MNKLLAVFKREYLSAVRKKMFIVMTFLLPVLMAGLMVLPGMVMMRGLGEKKIVVLDGTGQLESAYSRKPSIPGKNRSGVTGRGVRSMLNVDYVSRNGDQNLDATAKQYIARMNAKGKEKIDGVFVIPADAIANTDAHLKYYSRSATDFIGQERLGSITNRAIHTIRLSARGIPVEELASLMKDSSVDGVQVSKSGAEKKGGAANFIVGFVMTALLLVPSFIYGLEIMRGIIQEKTDRVIEVLVSSMSPSQLLVGKILGVAAVGLTQIAVWLVMLALAGAYITTTAAMAGENILQLLRPATFVYFVIFFILAYLTYVCIYAIGGSVCNSEKEAQQLIAPITMIMMLPWFLLVAIITSPDSKLSVVFSLSPVFGPLTMYVRTLVADPPMWHIAVCIAVSIATIFVFFWATAKIFRVGILSYGKRPSIPEILRWIRVA
ncbi:MAG: ABC transporter permease [Thermoanaerobaculia bacterium]|nr:ABC transporter permease [Thermoanaerobaculia bacterium]